MDLESSYVDSACEFLGKLQTPSLTLEDLCRILALSTFSHAALDAVLIFDVKKDGLVSMSAGFGAVPKSKNDHQNLSLNNQSPVTKAIRLNRLVKVDGNSRSKGTQTSAQIALPIRKLGAPIGCIGLIGKELALSDQGMKFLELLSLIISLRFYAENHYNESIRINRTALLGDPLSDRERMIQALMARGRTNLEIAEELGFSDSTIRQDAIRLFAKLGVSNRGDAGNLYKK